MLVQPKGTVEDVLRAIDDAGREAADLEIRLPLDLSYQGKPVPFDFAMAVILDRLLSYQLFPRGYSADGEGWRIYRYEREEGPGES